MQDFLGFGLLRPFRRDDRADFSAAGGVALVKSCVGQILGTVGSSEFTQGEIPWRTDLGSLLHLLRHRKNDALLQELGRVYVVDALKRWEPRVLVTSTQIARQQKDGEDVLAIFLAYDLIATNTPGNNVIVAGITQVVLV